MIGSQHIMNMYIMCVTYSAQVIIKKIQGCNISEKSFSFSFLIFIRYICNYNIYTCVYVILVIIIYTCAYVLIFIRYLLIHVCKSVEIICIILYYLWNFENKYSVCLSVCLSVCPSVIIIYACTYVLIEEHALYLFICISDISAKPTR